MQPIANCKAVSGDANLWIGERMANSRVDTAVGHKMGKDLYIDLGGSRLS